MPTTFKVSIWETDVWVGKTKTTWWVRWITAGKKQKEKFYKSRLAKSFKGKLETAAAEGIAFDIESGLPVTMLQDNPKPTPTASWLDVARSYVDDKWDDSAPKSRKSTADALVPVTIAMLKSLPTGRRSGEAEVRTALRWTFNKKNREIDPPQEIANTLRWVEKNMIELTALNDPATMKELVRKFEKKRDDSRAAPDTIRLRRLQFRSTIEFGVSNEMLAGNPLVHLKAPKRDEIHVEEVDPRCVVNPVQARTLLLAVSEQPVRGQKRTAFFGSMYYCGLRPEEAQNLRKSWLTLPDSGWGEIYLGGASPEVGAEWTDSGTRSEERGLKHRPRKAGRAVPIPPEQVRLFKEHIDRYGVDDEGRLFRGARGGLLGSTVYGRSWDDARRAVFADEVYASPLARRPYDLRHACLSTWLRVTGDPAQVAEWAGNSVRVLLRSYAKCLDGGKAAALATIERALGGG